MHQNHSATSGPTAAASHRADAHPPERAPAKINLFLHVIGRRRDGYHLLESLVVFADVGDRLTAERAEELSLRLSGPFAADAPTGPDNLALAAAQALRDGAGKAGLGATLTLVKNLPVGGGIGGGSADAAATLRALCRLWSLKPPPDRLAAMAVGLGADVPVCLASRPALVRGIGEVIEPLDALPALPAVLVNPGVSVSTAEVFRRFAATAEFRREGARVGAVGSPRALAAGLREQANDLEPAASEIAPAVGLVLAAIRGEAGNLLARMSGSGPTCFGLFASAEDAARAARRIGARAPDWWARAVTLRGAGA